MSGKNVLVLPIGGRIREERNLNRIERRGSEEAILRMEIGIER